MENSGPAAVADTGHCRGHGRRASWLHIQSSQGEPLLKPRGIQSGKGAGRLVSPIGPGLNTGLEQIARGAAGTKANSGNVEIQMLGLNSKYPLAFAADAPKDLKFQGTLAQPNHSSGRGPEHGNYRGDSASEQPQLGCVV